MADYRTNILVFKFFVNLVLPGALLVFDSAKTYNNKKTGHILPDVPLVFIPYALLTALTLLICAYVYYKKVKYSRVFLRKIYLPSNKVFCFFAAGEIPLVMWLHWVYEARFWGALHVLIALSGFLFVYARRNSQRVRISSYENNFKLGVMSPEVEVCEAGLKPGEVVKIVKTTVDGYIVKNSRGIEFQVPTAHISEIIGMI